jgi:hypothetical protein
VPLWGDEKSLPSAPPLAQRPPRSESGGTPVLHSVVPKAGRQESFDLVEVFAGSGHLSQAMRARGGTTWEIELTGGWDIFNPRVQARLFALIAQRRVRWVHLAPPCRTFSLLYQNCGHSRKHQGTRRTGRPEGDGSNFEENDGNRFADIAARLAEACRNAGVWWSVEHPSTSWMWKLSRWQRLFSKVPTKSVVLHMCAWGGNINGVPYLKPTRFGGDAPWLHLIARSCPRNHSHGWLEGKKKTTAAGAYPRELCRTCVSHHLRYCLDRYGSALSSSSARNSPDGDGLADAFSQCDAAPSPEASPEVPWGPKGVRGLVGPGKWKRWNVCVAVTWRHANHINVLESRAEALTLSWLLRKGTPEGARKVVLLQDSQVALYAGSKGRSSRLPLLLSLRFIAAQSLVGNFYVERLWIPSKSNPADGPSRGRAVGSF